MPKMEADCIHGYDFGDGCPICSKKYPKVGEPFTFEMPVRLNALTDCEGTDGLNNLMDEFFWDKYGEEFMLSDISYKPMRVVGEDIIIEVTAAQVESEEDEDEDEDEA